MNVGSDACKVLDESRQRFFGKKPGRRRIVSMQLISARSSSHPLRCGSIGMRNWAATKKCGITRNHIDAIDGAGFDTEIAASAFDFDHGMHQLGAAQDRIDGAGLDTFSATYALLFSNYRHCEISEFAVGRVEITNGVIEKFGEFYNCLPSAWWALIARFAETNCLGVGQAAWMAALTALSLRKRAIDTVYQCLLEALLSANVVANLQNQKDDNSKQANTKD